jgi:hypothetical protein
MTVIAGADDTNLKGNRGRLQTGLWPASGAPGSKLPGPAIPGRFPGAGGARGGRRGPRGALISAHSP